MRTGGWVAAAGKQRAAALPPVVGSRRTSPEGGQVHGFNPRTRNGADGNAPIHVRGPRSAAQLMDIHFLSDPPDHMRGVYFDRLGTLIGIAGMLLYAFGLGIITPRADTISRGWVSQAGRRIGNRLIRHRPIALTWVGSAPRVGGERRRNMRPPADDAEWIAIARFSDSRGTPPRPRARGGGRVRRATFPVPRTRLRCAGCDAERGGPDLQRRGGHSNVGVAPRHAGQGAVHHHRREGGDRRWSGDVDDGDPDDLMHWTMTRTSSLDLAWASTVGGMLRAPHRTPSAADSRRQNGRQRRRRRGEAVSVRTPRRVDACIRKTTRSRRWATTRTSRAVYLLMALTGGCRIGEAANPGPAGTVDDTANAGVALSPVQGLPIVSGNGTGWGTLQTWLTECSYSVMCIQEHKVQHPEDIRAAGDSADQKGWKSFWSPAIPSRHEAEAPSGGAAVMIRKSLGALAPLGGIDVVPGHCAAALVEAGGLGRAVIY